MAINNDLRKVILECLDEVSTWEGTSQEDQHFMACGAALKWAEAHSALDPTNPEMLAAINAAVNMIKKERKC